MADVTTAAGAERDQRPDPGGGINHIAGHDYRRDHPVERIVVRIQAPRAPEFLPAEAIVFRFDRDDPVRTLAILGKKFCLSGGMPNALLAQGTAAELIAQSGATTLEDAFVSVLGTGEGLAA